MSDPICITNGELENPFQGQSQTIKNVCISPNIENLHRHNLTLIPKQRKQWTGFPTFWGFGVSLNAEKPLKIFVGG